MGFVLSNAIHAGDLLRVRRAIGYFHFGVAVSDNEVIHFSGTDDDSIFNHEKVCIIKTSLSEFLKGDQCEIESPYVSPFSREEIVERAHNYLGQNTFMGKPYNLLSNNCEHFARYVYFGKKDSGQVNVVVGTASAVLAAGATFVASAVVNKVKANNNNSEDNTKNEIVKK